MDNVQGPDPPLPQDSSASKQHLTSAPNVDSAATTLLDLEDFEEGKAAYRPGGFHPVYVGDVYKDRYLVLNKVGYGVYSTVWLVRDLLDDIGEENRFRALKVLSAECYGQGHDTFEKEILTHLRDGDRRQLGYAYVCHLVDDF
ncbi:SRSF protein kinase 3 [Tolypocladium ophioglossoides CBS 100239]|uniref:non-specific serine/threonine protein kinase n=1 Tax=Tolypocladium ophioglossoides (strain CBS 100239) TaxID=1163406 RepID=A0A0L0N5Q2_TOLOC|nr:SRSF protein kinase 3 [Tolypocladium ophioglossoides CBS 100239]